MAAIHEPSITLRAATPEDLPFLIELRRQTMLAHQRASGVVQSEEELVSRVLARYECANVILVGSEPIGLLKVSREGLQWEVMQIQLSPGWQRRGLGRLLLERVIRDARSAGATLRLNVLRANPARRLYERLGFAIVEAREHAYTMQLGAFQTPTFTPLTRDDLPMLHEWLQRPHIAEWWGEPSTLIELEDDYLPVTMNESSTRAYIAMLERQPIGFIQSYVAMDSGDGWWEKETDPGARGIDQFLANAGQLGRGLGSAMVRAFVQYLFEDPAVTRIQTDPSPRNERAIRSYLRAGFVVHDEIVTPDGPAVLMLRYR